MSASTAKRCYYARADRIVELEDRDLAGREDA